MLKLLVLCLIVKATASAVETDETEGSADIGSDDEDYQIKTSRNSEHTGNSDKSRGDSEDLDGVITIIIIVAVSAALLILIVIGAVFLVKHHMHNMHQGMYAVPAEQAQKGTI